MKRWLLILALALAASGGVWGQYQYEYEATVAWDPVAPEVATDTIEYEVYVWPMTLGDPTAQAVEGLTYLGTTAETSFPIDVPYREAWAVCVRTKQTDVLGATAFSPFAYSTVEADTLNGQTFVIIEMLINVVAPTNIRAE